MLPIILVKLTVGSLSMDCPLGWWFVHVLVKNKYRRKDFSNTFPTVLPFIETQYYSMIFKVGDWWFWNATNGLVTLVMKCFVFVCPQCGQSWSPRRRQSGGSQTQKWVHIYEPGQTGKCCCLFLGYMFIMWLMFFRRSTRTPAATWSIRRPTRIWRDKACCRLRRKSLTEKRRKK